MLFEKLQEKPETKKIYYGLKIKKDFENKTTEQIVNDSNKSPSDIDNNSDCLSNEAQISEENSVTKQDQNKKKYDPYGKLKTKLFEVYAERFKSKRKMNESDSTVTNSSKNSNPLDLNNTAKIPENSDQNNQKNIDDDQITYESNDSKIDTTTNLYSELYRN